MNSPLRFTEGRRGGRGRGLIQLYILHSLKIEPKSGYELLKEISEKTKGAWVPSKGTMYPMLKKMESEGLIIVSETGMRGKNIYELAGNGEELLDDIVTKRREEREKMYVFRDLLFEIFGQDKTPLMADLHELHFIAGKIPDEKQEKAGEIIKKFIAELQELTTDESSSS